MSISTALKARQEALRDREAGFTLIELLVVVIIIGILAAIAIPVYLGVQTNAKDSSVKSDLTNAKNAIVTYGTDTNGALPDGITAAGSATKASQPTVDLTKNGWSKGTNTSDLAYVAGASGTWCVVGTGSTNNKFVITSSTEVKAYTGAGACTPS